jgi:hypothetical protein
VTAITEDCITQVARVVHAANTELQKITGDEAPSLPWDCESPEIRESAIAGVRAALEGATPEELHAEWCRNKAAQGWRRGAAKNEAEKTHPCLVPYAELPEAQRVKDAVFAAIVRAMAGDPEPEDEPEWDSVDSSAYQQRNGGEEEDDL